MALDIAAEADGDLIIQGGGLKVATDAERDRNMIMVRIMTMQGEVETLPFMGVPIRFIGMPVEPGTKARLESAIREALAIDGALIGAKPTIKAIITGYDRMMVIVQSNRVYRDAERGEHMKIIGDFYSMNDMPVTRLDGSEG